jgi:putative phosphoribosyl transferase
MMVDSGIFADREEAGRLLASELLRFKDQQPVVLALPRGGVPVAVEVADALHAPLDLILVRKIGAPWQPELAIAAVVDGDRPETVVNQAIVDQFGIGDSYLKEQEARQLAEIERRRQLYLADRPRAGLAGRTAIITDDGIATGATMQAALHAIQRARPKRLVLAVPVAPPDTIERLRREVDEVVCLLRPAAFGAISLFYADFHQITDDEIVGMLDRTAAVDPAVTS